MKEQEEIAYINSHKKEAGKFNKNAMVVSAERARAAVERAYIKGMKTALENMTKDKHYGI